MTQTLPTYDRDTRTWVFPDGKRLPLVSGGDPTADPAGEPVVTLTPETPPAPPAAPANPDARFTADDIEKARQQEKDKLYGRIDTLSEQMKLFQQEREAAQSAAAQAAAEAEAERKRKEEEELGLKDLLLRKEDEWASKFEATQTQWADRFSALEAERDAHAALLEKEREFQHIQSYKQRRLQEEGDNVMADLYQYVSGDTEEAIEAAISSAKATTSAIVEQVSALIPQRPVVRPVPATGQAPSGPSENLTGQQTYTMDQLKGMDMATYAANRARLLEAVSRKGS